VTLRSRAGLAWSVLALDVSLLAAGVLLSLANGSNSSEGSDWGTPVGAALVGFAFLAFPVVGALIATRDFSNSIGWLCLGVGFAFGLTALASEYGIYGVLTEPGSVPAPEYGLWLQSWSWLYFIAVPAVFFPLLFPDGRLLSPRWLAVPWLAGSVLIAASVGTALSPGPLDEARYADNPLGLEDAGTVVSVLDATIVLLLPLGVAAAVSLVLRYRRSRGEERLQLKWFVTAAVGAVLVFFVGLALTAIASPPFDGIAQDIATLGWATLPIAVGISILRYRLYDIDVVISKALVFSALAVFITGVYVAIVVGVSALVGSAGDPSIVLSIVATAIVAVAFQPARERAQQLANRLVYGSRATPYEILARFSEQAALDAASEDVLGTVARIVGEGTGAGRSDVWVKSGRALRLGASWPEPPADGPRELALADGRLPTFADIDAAAPVRHQGELLGALTVAKRRGESLAPDEEKLLRDLAAQAGLVLRNAGLTAELLARLEDLRASRERLVTAQDEERRRLERDLHDGAQQHLVGLKVKLNLAARQADDAALKEALTALQADADEAVEALRDLAHGIYPPLLAEQGLPAAIEAHARKSPLVVELEADGIGRYPQDIEAAVYFCCLEALQNVAKYADAARAVVRVSETDGDLHFAVEDDGAGFDPAATPRGSGLQNMADRAEALGGTLEVTSAPGAGTQVNGRLPLAARSSAPSELEAALP
jgi:signal transduction histidine kinase